jgi:parallel beta-helix repeat protein
MKFSPILLAAALVTLLTLVTRPLHATTLVVDNQHPRAADANPGTRESPLKTISAAAKRVQPGDTVLVRPGLYREAVTLTVSGKPGQPIVFKSEEPRKAIVSGADPITEWRQEGAGVWSAAIPPLKFNRYSNGEWVYADGYPMDRVIERARLSPGTFYFDFDPPAPFEGRLGAPAPDSAAASVAQRVFVAPAEGQDIKGLKVEMARREGLFWAAATLEDIHIIGFTVIYNADWSRGKRAVSAQGPRWRIEDNHILWASYQGLVTSRSNGTVVRGNLIEWCGDQAIGGGSNIDLLVEDNQFYYHNWRRFNPNSEGGISKWVFTLNSHIRRNKAGFYYGYGLWMDIANAGNLIEDNVSHDSVGGASLFTEISWDDIIQDNISFNNNHGITIGESPGTTVARNIVYNNSIGVRMRGDHRRRNTDHALYEKHLASIRDIPGISPVHLAQWHAGYLKYWQSQDAYLSNNAVIWENILFGNSTNYFEVRNYASPSALDPFVNNFSDNNIYWQSNPASNVAYSGGTYADLASWQRASGRDKNSVFTDPRASGTNLPEWAAAKRAMWDQKFRSHEELQALKLGLLDSPMAAIARGRLFRSASVKPLPTRDPAIKAFLLEVDGQKTLAAWTSQQTDRRYLRINVASPTVTVENGYLGSKQQRTAGGILDIPVNWVPTYIRGIGENVNEIAGTNLKAGGFTLPGRPVPLTATFINDAKTARTLTASFSASPGFAAVPAQATRTLKPGEKTEIALSLKPDGTFNRGVGQARVEATTGDEHITRIASFSVGEGAGTLPFTGQPLTVDGRIDDWKALGDAAIVGVMAEASQIATGDGGKWTGTKDLGGRLYAAWGKDALYAAVVVTDDTLLPASGDTPWDGDSVEFFLDGRSAEMQWQQGFTEGVFQIGIGPPATPGGKPSVRVLGPTELKGLTTAASRTPEGYIVEMRIPLTLQNFPAGDWQDGRAVKLSALIGDRDEPGKNGGEYKMGWSFSPQGRNNQDTSGWATLLLGSK